MPGLITGDFQLLIMSPVTRDSCPTHACPSSTINYPPVNKSTRQKKKNSSSSQASLAYLYVCSSAAVRLQVIKSALWWDEQYVDKVLRRDDDQDLQRKRACLSLIWVGIAIFFGWNRFCPMLNWTLAQEFKHRLTLCLHYDLIPHLSDSLQVPGDVSRVAHSDNKGFWSLIMQTQRHTSTSQNGEVRAPDFNTLTHVQQTYTMHKTCEGERQQARWHVKLPWWCIA